MSSSDEIKYTWHWITELSSPQYGVEPLDPSTINSWGNQENDHQLEDYASSWTFS